MTFFITFILIALSQPALAGDILYFKGYRCTQDCSGHKAGYAWAEKKDIRDPALCTAKAQSFNEGCKAWAEEQQEKDPIEDTNSALPE